MDKKGIKIMGQLPLEKLARKQEAGRFPGVKQQEEASAKAETARQLQNDRVQLKAVRQEEDTAKKALLEREKENHSKIFAQKCFNGWLRIFDNSAMILAKWLDGKLGRTYEASPDQ